MATHDMNRFLLYKQVRLLPDEIDKSKQDRSNTVTMNQLDFFSTSSEHPLTKGLNTVEDGEYLFYPDFFNRQECKTFFSSLRTATLWKQESISIYGKRRDLPRLTAWYGDLDKPYSFSGITLNPNPWTPELREIKERIETVANVKFNSVLLNLYRGGQDSISWHTDAEYELGPNPVIGSVSFGETRTFQLKHVKSNRRIDIALTDGVLLLMMGAMQHYWQHQIPKTKQNLGERINLTFRVIK
jgi:alkylated DNA repair dioxygenase AlkB